MRFMNKEVWDMELIYRFDTKETPELLKVGGKANSLILMTKCGLPVPTGFVLSVAFFEPWFDQIKETAEWQHVVNSSPNELKRHTEELKKACERLKLDNVRRGSLAEMLNSVEIESSALLFAVRSSSPEEDLEGASFAGGYETTLGVTKENIEDALLRSFVSSLDERVFVYKKEHGFPMDNPRIAVIVQVQIPSETAGVAFSLNPINNCYDEAVINANFGLGETVVSGSVSPDTFIVDKVSGKILEKIIGKKENSIWLAADGGTYEKPSPSKQSLSLSDDNISTLMNMLVDVENYYNKPIDIEWAFAEDWVYLLQARPITAYIPLPVEMQTVPGRQKLLYLDQTLAKQGIHEPLSVMGTDLLSLFGGKIEKAMTGKNISDVVEGTAGSLQGRMYLNISNNIKLYGNKKLINTYNSVDKPSAEIIENMDENEYVPKSLPLKLRGVKWGTVQNSFGMIVSVFKALKHPEEYEKRLAEQVELFVGNLKKQPDSIQSIEKYVESITNRFVSFFVFSLPVLVVMAIPKVGIEKIFKDSSEGIRSKVTYLEKAMPNNVTTEMGLSMYRLSRFEEISQCQSIQEFKEKLETKVFSKDFMNSWDSFIEKYGFRCPRELDIATPRYYEQLDMLYGQLKGMAANTDAVHNPQTIFDRARTEREKEYEELLKEASKMGKAKAKKFTKYYKLLVIFLGYREAPKYYWIMTVGTLRKKVLETAEALVLSGRLEYVNQVFDLKIEDLERVITDLSADVGGMISRNTAFLKTLANIREFPRVIDSRGKIFYPPRKKGLEGELVGYPISPGIVRGKVKVLRSPDEKPVLPGEILVARATDPGWTPLFINAAGVILEVGGVLQHGALIAREYGKPCVSGIEDAVSILKDGQMIELDGLNGIVRLL